MKQFIVKCQVKDLLEKIKEAWNTETIHRKDHGGTN